MRSLFEFIKRYNYVFLFLLLEVVALVIMGRGTYYQNSRLLRTGNAIAGCWYSWVEGIEGYFDLRAENDRLAQENAMLRAHQEESYLKYNDSVFVVEDTVFRQRFSYMDAQIIKTSVNGQSNFLLIDRGSRQNVKPDMAVISPDGIVGVVVSTTNNFASIMPVLHPDSRNSVKLKRTGSTGSLIWEGGDYRYAYMVDVPSTHKLYAGDTVVTSGFAHDFPEGIMVGFIDKLYLLKGTGFYKVRIRLSTDFSSLQHVYVINNYFKEEQDSLGVGNGNFH